MTPSIITHASTLWVLKLKRNTKLRKKILHLISSSKSRCSILRNRTALAVKVKTYWIMYVCICRWGCKQYTEEVISWYQLLTLKDSVGILCSCAQNSSMLKNIKPSFLEILTGRFQRCEDLLNNNKNWKLWSHWK